MPLRRHASRRRLAALIYGAALSARGGLFHFMLLFTPSCTCAQIFASPHPSGLCPAHNIVSALARLSLLLRGALFTAHPPHPTYHHPPHRCWDCATLLPRSQTCCNFSCNMTVYLALLYDVAFLRTMQRSAQDAERWAPPLHAALNNAGGICLAYPAHA